jgi:hypothetical protein
MEEEDDEDGRMEEEDDEDGRMEEEDDEDGRMEEEDDEEKKDQFDVLENEVYTNITKTRTSNTRDAIMYPKYIVLSCLFSP